MRGAFVGVLAALSLLGGACAGAKKDALIGESTAPPTVGTGSREGGAPAFDAGIPADYATSFAHIGAPRFVSNGHAAGRWEVDVYANDAGRDPLTSGHGDVSIGAMIVEAHFERMGPGGRGPLMMMEKREKGFDSDHGDWRYVVVTGNGDLVKEGAIESCAGCHDDAPHDHLFKVQP